MSSPQLLDRMCMTLGGRVAEEIFFGADQITTGAQDDLQKITRMAFEVSCHSHLCHRRRANESLRQACANYGMNNVIGPVSYGGERGSTEHWNKPFSEKTAERLDEEVRKMIVYVFHDFHEAFTDDSPS